MRTAAPCSITARRRSSALSTRPAANSTASSVNPSAEPSSYPQIPRTRLQQILKVNGPGASQESRYRRSVLRNVQPLNRSGLFREVLTVVKPHGRDQAMGLHIEPAFPLPKACPFGNTPTRLEIRL